MESRLAEPLVPGVVEYAYGSDPLQRLDFWVSGKAGAPLVIFVHGGGWKRGDKRNATGMAKVRHWQEQGYAVASINYRLVPGASVEQQAQDVADAVAWLRKDAHRLGFDADRIALAGHSAGAHLVALVGTDGRYLDKAGLRLSDLSGVLPIDGACYDVPAQMKDGPRVMQGTYQQAFGTDPDRQRDLSPVSHAAAPNAPVFLIIHVQRDDGIRQSKELAAALTRGGTAVERREFSGTGLRGHMEINRSLGDPDYPATPVVDEWLRRVFSPS
ncbi:MAG: alpha/beta hydrolase [Sphingobium sp.]